MVCRHGFSKPAGTVWVKETGKEKIGAVRTNGFLKQILVYHSSPPLAMQVNSKVLHRAACDDLFRRKL